MPACVSVSVRLNAIPVCAVCVCACFGLCVCVPAHVSLCSSMTVADRRWSLFQPLGNRDKPGDPFMNNKEQVT